jgi:nucleotide-binding universal stress UspA family protein
MLPHCKKILYTTDLSSNSAYVLIYALHEAQKHGARLEILHVIEELPPTTLVLTESFLANEAILDISEDKKTSAKERMH